MCNAKKITPLGTLKPIQIGLLRAQFIPPLHCLQSQLHQFNDIKQLIYQILYNMLLSYIEIQDFNLWFQQIVVKLFFSAVGSLKLYTDHFSDFITWISRRWQSNLVLGHKINRECSCIHFSMFFLSFKKLQCMNVFSIN